MPAHSHSPHWIGDLLLWRGYPSKRKGEPLIELRIYGPLRGGKNNMGVTRTGVHYPLPQFVKWRAEVSHQILTQIARIKTIDQPCSMHLEYWRGDERRRDLPAMLDGLFHVLERTKIVKDDSLITELHWIPRGLDRANPRCLVRIEPKKENE